MAEPSLPRSGSNRSWTLDRFLAGTDTDAHADGYAKHQEGYCSQSNKEHASLKSTDRILPICPPLRVRRRDSQSRFQGDRRAPPRPLWERNAHISFVFLALPVLGRCRRRVAVEGVLRRVIRHLLGPEGRRIARASDPRASHAHIGRAVRRLVDFQAGLFFGQGRRVGASQLVAALGVGLRLGRGLRLDAARPRACRGLRRLVLALGRLRRR